MSDSKGPLQLLSEDLALKIVYCYKKLVADHKEFVLSRQLLKSGTSIGANIAESQHAQSKADFVNKLSIAQKEAVETVYWIDLLCKSNYLKFETAKEFIDIANEIQDMLSSAIITTKQRYLTKYR